MEKFIFLMLLSSAAGATTLTFGVDINDGSPLTPITGEMTDTNGVWTAHLSNGTQGGYADFQDITVFGNHFKLSDDAMISGNDPARNYISFDIGLPITIGVSSVVFSARDTVFGPGSNVGERGR